MQEPAPSKQTQTGKQYQVTCLTAQRHQIEEGPPNAEALCVAAGLQHSVVDLSSHDQIFECWSALVWSLEAGKVVLQLIFLGMLQ